MPYTLSYANIEVFRDGQLVGKAEYDSRSGSANMNKFIKGENKVRELVELLFPVISSTDNQPADVENPERSWEGQLD